MVFTCRVPLERPVAVGVKVIVTGRTWLGCRTFGSATGDTVNGPVVPTIEIVVGSDPELVMVKVRLCDWPTGMGGLNRTEGLVELTVVEPALDEQV